MNVSNDTEKYLQYYMDSITFLGKLQLGAMKMMAQQKSYGSEYISCSFDPNDEDYQAGYVTLIFWKPAVKEDTMVYIDNNMFYDFLLRLSEDQMKSYPELENELRNYLQQIKNLLKI